MTTPESLLAEALSLDAGNEQSDEERDFRNEWWDRPSELATRLLAHEPLRRAIEAGLRSEAVTADVADLYYRLESALGHLDGVPEQVVQDIYFTFKHAERLAERLDIIGPDPVASVLDVEAR